MEGSEYATALITQTFLFLVQEILIGRFPTWVFPSPHGSPLHCHILLLPDSSTSMAHATFIMRPLERGFATYPCPSSSSSLPFVNSDIRFNNFDRFSAASLRNIAICYAASLRTFSKWVWFCNDCATNSSTTVLSLVTSPTTNPTFVSSFSSAACSPWVVLFFFGGIVCDNPAGQTNDKCQLHTRSTRRKDDAFRISYCGRYLLLLLWSNNWLEIRNTLLFPSLDFTGRIVDEVEFSTEFYIDSRVCVSDGDEA
ncbi:hypothetical protein V8G54_027304 [Vigna mungo]|uniref:Uncharacterized protein n=1 Tax=Vigna mungo TaxID=3915 RepID=A0AAQ3N2F5_VIGMU